jgi:GNAT superfamily N-acetyltransferase
VTPRARAIAAAFTVRPADPSDAAAISAVHVDSITTLGARGYTPEQVASWCQPCVPQRYIDAMARGERFFLSVTSEAVPELLGFSAYRVEHGRHRIATYVAAHAARRGVGTALYRVAEELARRSGAREVHVDSSLVAVEFYLALGFIELARGAHRLRIGGELPCVFMRKALVSDPSPRAP